MLFYFIFYAEQNKENKKKNYISVNLFDNSDILHMPILRTKIMCMKINFSIKNQRRKPILLAVPLLASNRINFGINRALLII